MTNIVLKATTREITGKKVHRLRQDGQIPAVLYGHGTENKNLTLDLINFKRIYKEAGTSNLIDLEVDEQKVVKVLLKEPDIHPISMQPYHFDIYQVKMTEKLTTEIPLEFINESPAVVELEGSLVKNFDALEVECLPADLVSNFDVDLSLLKTFDDVIKISDINIPSSIEVKIDADEIVAQVMPPRSEEELAELETEVVEDVDKVEVTEEKPVEGEAAEGEKAGDNKSGDVNPISDKSDGSKPETSKSE